jgi:hypothetical protein
MYTTVEPLEWRQREKKERGEKERMTSRKVPAETVVVWCSANQEMKGKKREKPVPK